MPRRINLKSIFLAILLAGFAAWPVFRILSGPHRESSFIYPGASVILVTVEGLRGDFSRFTAVPGLESFERDAISFRAAVTPSPLTLPAHASVMTGDYPPRHGLRGMVSAPLPQARVTLAEVFHQSGYRTGAIVSSPLLDHRFGLDQGFDHFDDSRSIRVRRSECAPGSPEWVSRRAIEWLREQKDKPFFLWIQYTAPFLEAGVQKESSRLHSLPGSGHYASTLLRLDEQIGAFFHFLRRNDFYDPLIILLAGVHGEGLGEQGETGHGLFLGEATVHVPLFLKLPAGQVRATGDITEPVSLVDLRSTLLGLTAIPDDHPGDRISLISYLQGEIGMERMIYLESTYPEDQLGGPFLRGLRMGSYLFLEGWGDKLQYLPADSEESADQLVWDPELEGKLRASLATISARMEADAAIPGPPRFLDREFSRTLRSCGFLERVRAPVPAFSREMTLTRAVGLQARLTRVRQLLAGGAVRRAEKILQEAVANDPGNGPMIHLLGLVRWQRGDPEDAETFLSAALEIDPHRPAFYRDLALLHRQTGNLTAAVHVLEKGVGRHWDSVPMRTLLASTLALAGDTLGAGTHFQAALKLSGNHREALRGLADLARGKGNFPLAAERLREILARNPALVETRVALGQVLLEKGEFELLQGQPQTARLSLIEAMGEFRSVLLREPDHPGAAEGLDRARQDL